MANPRAFISFDYDHNINEKNLFIGQSKLSRTPFNIEDWSSKNHLPQSQWESIIEDKIKRSNLLIVLVGKYMSSATGVHKEIEFAKKNNVPIFGVYVGDANNTSSLPEGLQRNRTIVWEWDSVAAAINQTMKEGKNK